MREAFREKRFKPESLALVEKCAAIIERYQEQGLRLTLRQLYYQLVTVNAITNEEKSYKNLSSLVSDARLAGLLDWDAIEDRVRQPRVCSEFEDLNELVEAALSSYRLPRWRGQQSYVELWVEKDALAGVLTPLARKFHVTMMVNRGYSSQSAMYESAKRFIEKCDDTLQPVLLYLGDHDPSGEDMVRDIRDRLEMFGVEGVEVTKVALTTAQVQQYKPPPNPAKVTDPRARAYIAKHGPVSWEVDALEPSVLSQLITREFSHYIDQEELQAVVEQEKLDKAELSKAVEEITAKRRE